MIKTKKDLLFYIKADRIMNGYSDKIHIKERLLSLLLPRPIDYLESMRKYAYYKHKNKILKCFWGFRYGILGTKFSFSIGCNVFGYGLVIPHYGTIVVNNNVRIGNFAVLHTGTCIAGGDKIIGDGLYLSTGSQIVGKVRLGDNVSICAHSLVNNNFDNNILIAGSPAVIKKNNYPSWYCRDGETFVNRVNLVNKLKKQYDE